MFRKKKYILETMTCGQYLNKIKKEDIKTDQDVQREFCWNDEMTNELIYSAVSNFIYIPNLIVADQIMENNTQQTYVADGGQRTYVLSEFRYNGLRTKNTFDDPIIPYLKNKKDENGNYIRDEYGNIVKEEAEFDMKCKCYDDLPEELKDQFNECELHICRYLECTREEVSEIIKKYNNHTGMTVAQKSFTNAAKIAPKINEIVAKSSFLKNGTMLTESEKRKGIWKRAVAEAMMGVCHYNEWRQNPKSIFKFLNNNATKEDFAKIEKYFEELDSCSDKLDSPDVAKLFTSKNFFIWIMFFDRAMKLHITTEQFKEFLEKFVSNLKFNEVSGKTWEEIDSNRHAKSKVSIEEKLNYLESLLKEYFCAEDIKENEEENTLDFIHKCVSEDVLEEDISLYEEVLYDLTVEVDNNSKLLQSENTKSLLAIIAYSFIYDKYIDEWFVDFFCRENTYKKDQEENYTYMVKDLENYLSKNAA